MNSLENKHIGCISIIMPFYKAENYVARIIKDIQSQSYTDWELIAVSNGPGQEVQNKIVNDFANNDHRIKLICTKTSGVSNARNLGLSKVNGEWVTFVDVDDRLAPYHLSKYANAVEKDIDVVCGGFVYNDGENDTKKVFIDEKTCKEPNIKKYLQLPPLVQGTVWTKLYNYNFLKLHDIPFPTGVSFCEDRIWNYQILKKTNRIKFIPQTGYKYLYVSGASASSKYHYNFDESMKIVRQLTSELYVKAGYCEEETKAKEERLLYIHSYFAVRNMFGVGCPLTIEEKIDRVKTNIFNNIYTCSVIKRYVSKGNENFVMGLFNFLFRTKSPFLMVMTYSVIFSVKRMFGI